MRCRLVSGHLGMFWCIFGVGARIDMRVHFLAFGTQEPLLFLQRTYGWQYYFVLEFVRRWCEVQTITWTRRALGHAQYPRNKPISCGLVCDAFLFHSDYFTRVIMEARQIWHASWILRRSSQEANFQH